MNLWRNFTNIIVGKTLRMSKGAVMKVVNSDNTESTVSLAELGVLDGLTATAAELNIMDGVLATTAEINRACDTSTRVVSAAAATLAVTELAHDGKVIVLNKADGVTATLPAATGSGARFTFIVGTTVTSNGYIIKVADATDLMDGVILAADDTATPVALVWVTAADSDTITLDGSTKGGLIGDRVELVDIATNQYAVHGVLKQSGTEASPFSATVA